jgi:hypothetical protein
LDLISPSLPVQFLMQTMFHKLSVEVPAEKRAFEAKIASQEEELRSLRAIAAASGALFHPDFNLPVGEGKRKHLKSAPDAAVKKSQATGAGAGVGAAGGAAGGASSHNLSALMRPTTSSAMHAKPKIKPSKVPKAISATKVLSERRANGISSEDDDNRRQGTGEAETKSAAKRSRSSHESSEEEEDLELDPEEGEGEGDEEEDVVSYESSSEDELDETFFPEEEEEELSDVSEDEDLMIEPIRGRRPLTEPTSSSSSVASSITSASASSKGIGEGDKETKGGKGKKRSSKEVASSDDSSCSSLQKKSKTATAAAASASAPVSGPFLITATGTSIACCPLELPTFPLSKYKVPELKKFLAERSLPVGGTLFLPSPPSPSLALSM